MKYGVVGIGAWGSKVAKSLYNLGLLESVASNGNASNIRSIRELIGDVHLLTLDEILQSDVDVIFVCTPHESLAQIGKRVLSSGKHLILEKPGSTKISDLIDIETLRLSHNRSCFINYMYSCDPAVQIARTTVKNIREINYVWQKFGSFNNDILLNLLSHDIAVHLELDDSDWHIKHRTLDKDRVELVYQTSKIDKCHLLIDRRADRRHKEITVKDEKQDIVIRPGSLSINRSNVFTLEDDFLHNHLIYLDNKLPENISNIKKSQRILEIIEKVRNET